MWQVNTLLLYNLNLSDFNNRIGIKLAINMWKKPKLWIVRCAFIFDFRFDEIWVYFQQ